MTVVRAEGSIRVVVKRNGQRRHVITAHCRLRHPVAGSRCRSSAGQSRHDITASLKIDRWPCCLTVKRTDQRERCLGDRDQAWARPEREAGSPVYPARVVLDRQALAPWDQSAGRCRGLDLVASCCQSYMNLMEPVSGMGYDSGGLHARSGIRPRDDQRLR